MRAGLLDSAALSRLLAPERLNARIVRGELLAHSCRPARPGFHRFRHSAASIVNERTGNLKLAKRLVRREMADETCCSSVPGAMFHVAFFTAVRWTERRPTRRGSPTPSLRPSRRQNWACARRLRSRGIVERDDPNAFHECLG